MNLGLIQNEIVELHHFFENWYTGTLANTPQNLERFTTVLNPEFTIIMPGGQLIRYPALVEMIKSNYGTRADFRIDIKNIQVLFQYQEIITATYEEWQHDGQHTTMRISTVIFQQKDNLPNQLAWQHVHETWLNKDTK